MTIALLALTIGPAVAGAAIGWLIGARGEKRAREVNRGLWEAAAAAEIEARQWKRDQWID